jgi:hypothetical protein
MGLYLDWITPLMAEAPENGPVPLLPVFGLGPHLTPKDSVAVRAHNTAAASAKKKRCYPPLPSLVLSEMAAPSHVIPFLSPAGTAAVRGRRAGLLRCPAATGQAGFFTRLGRLIKEKAKSDVDKLFSGFSKTRENLSVVDELLTYWNLEDTDRVLDELEEVRTRFLISLSLSLSLRRHFSLILKFSLSSSPTQALLVSDFGPKISFRIVDTLREQIRDGMLKSGSEIKVDSVPP